MRDVHAWFIIAHRAQRLKGYRTLLSLGHDCVALYSLTMATLRPDPSILGLNEAEACCVLPVIDRGPVCLARMPAVMAPLSSATAVER